MRIAVWHHAGTSTGYAGAIGIEASASRPVLPTRHLRPDQQRARPTATEENGNESTRADQHVVFSQAGAD
jgi:hypothetical protein